MAPAVPFALLGVVQLLAVAGWVGLGGAALFPRLRRRVTPLFIVGALALAAADALTAVQFGSASSSGIGWLRVAGFALIAVGAAGGAGQSLVLPMPAGAAAGVVVPLGAPPLPSYVAGVVGVVAAGGAWRRGHRRGADRLFGTALAVGLLFAAVAAALGDPARTSESAALAELAARAASTIGITVALVQLARTMLLGKLAGAILAGVVAMAAGAVGVVGTGVADEVQSQQSQRLLQVAQAEQSTLNSTLGARTALFAQVVALCPGKQTLCVNFLKFFSEEASYFAVTVVPPAGVREIATNLSQPLPDVALVQLSGSAPVRAALLPGATVQSPAGGPTLLPGNPPTLAVVEAVPGRPNGSQDARVRPTFAAVYGVVVGDSYLGAVSRQTGYDVSVVADGRLVASSLAGAARQQLAAVVTRSRIDRADVSINRVLPAAGTAPTVALVPIEAAGNGDVRLATLAVSQPANEALRAQRSVLQRMFLTALVALLVVVLLALLLARRIAEPVRRLTVAAGRVRRGDLDTTTSVTSRDEVGSLARAFEAMTGSLRHATGELRSAAEQEAALRERLETVVESMSDGLVVTDARGRVTSVNATAARLAGIDAESAIGHAVGDVFAVTDDDGRSLLTASTDRRSIDARLTSSDGRLVPVRYSAAPLGDRQGRVIVIADRTREDEVERMKTEFLANVSHELRTPLTPIRGYAELLSRRPELSREQVESFLSEILSSTARMSRAVELLVDVAAIEGGRVAADVGKSSVRALVEDRLQVWKERYPERASDFKRRMATRLPAVAVDVHWVNRALDELADNAVKYTPAGTAITLVAGLDGEVGQVRVAVRDGGPGFDPAVAAELVGDFSQADASETRRVGGMGLGLGFVNRVAERFHLRLTVDAEPGKGAEFALYLPEWTDR
jgi:PAS domain S-box-containing protein